MLKNGMQFMQSRSGWLAVVCWLLLLLLVLPQAAWAVQAHGGAEGLVSHQLGHFLFVVALVTLLVRIRYHKLVSSGWREFKFFLWLLLCWNFLTFSGHWMREVVSIHKFVRVDGQIASYHIENVFDFFFYLTRLDHLLLVPAFLFLLLALHRWEAS